MGGFVNGPIIRFTIDTPGLSAAISPAMNDVKAQARAASESVAESWRVTAAKIRAELSSGVASQREMNSEREKLLGTLNSEIRALQQRNELSNRELASLKAMTLERERQVDAIKRGVGVGVTSGTTSALGQVSTQTTLGIERILDSLVNRYLGGAAGAATRTVRDVSYYANQASGGLSTGGLFGLSGTTLGVVGGAAALATVATALTGIAVKGGSLAIELTKLSEKTGLTVEETIKLRSATEALDGDFDRVVIGFKKFSSELVLAGTANLPYASKEAKEAAAIFKALGVDVKKAAQDPFTAVQQLAKTFQSLPDGIVKTTAATILFGRGGLENIPIFDKLDMAMAATGKSSRDLADALTGGKGAVEASEALQAQMVNFKNETNALEVALSQKLLPALVAVVGWINDHTTQIKGLIVGAANAFTGGTEGALASILGYFSGSKYKGSSSVDFSKLNEFLDPGGAANRTKRMQELAAAEGKVGDGAKQTAEALKEELEAREKMLTGTPKRNGVAELQARHDAEVAKILGLNAPPDIGLPQISFPFQAPITGGGLTDTSLSGGPFDIVEQLKKVKEEYLKEVYPNKGDEYADYVKQLQDDVEKVKAKYDEQLDYWKFIQSKYPDYAQQAADAILKIQQIENQKLADLQQKALEKYKKEADKLFDDLLSGKTKSFTKTLEKDIEDIVTQPARKMFDDIIGKMLQGIDQSVNGKGGSGTVAGSKSTSGGGILGTILGRFGINIGPGGTAGTFPGSIGLGSTTGTGSVAIPAGQVGVQTQTMNVQANVVNIGASPTGGSSSSTSPLGSNFLGGSPSTFFGNLNPFGGGASFWGNNNPLGGSTSAGGGGILGGNLGGLLGGLVVGGLGVMHGSVTSEAMGAASVATSLAKIFGAGNVAAIGPTSGTQNLGQQLGGIFSGAGMLASGLSQPGFSGELSDIAGGASIGTAIMPGIGTAIGAAAGAIAGLIKGIFSGPSWAQRVKHAMGNQAEILPPSETFSFASNGSISNTLQTGFSQSGNSFSTFKLPANTPFWANPIYGPFGSLKQEQQLAAEEGQFIPGQPFGGLTGAPNPFTGQGPSGTRNSSKPNVNVSFNLPGLVDPQAASEIFTKHATILGAIVGSQISNTSAGFGQNVRAAVGLP